MHLYWFYPNFPRFSPPGQSKIWHSSSRTYNIAGGARFIPRFIRPRAFHTHGKSRFNYAKKVFFFRWGNVRRTFFFFLQLPLTHKAEFAWPDEFCTAKSYKSLRIELTKVMNKSFIFNLAESELRERFFFERRTLLQFIIHGGFIMVLLICTFIKILFLIFLIWCDVTTDWGRRRKAI